MNNMVDNSVKSGQAQLVQEELASGTMEQEASSTVMVELEEQMDELNLDNNIQPRQGRNRIREGAQHRQRHHSWLGLHPPQIRNPNRQRRQQQRINVSRNINLQLLEDNMQRLIFGATRQTRENRRFRGRCCLRQSRLVALSVELVNHVPTITTELNRSPEDCHEDCE